MLRLENFYENLFIIAGKIENIFYLDKKLHDLKNDFNFLNF
jgi:hypothetical protein